MVSIVGTIPKPVRIDEGGGLKVAVWQHIHCWLDDPQNKLTRLGAKP